MLADAIGIAQIVQLGRSEEGRPIWALRIRASGTPTLGWRILGDHHGDEPSSGVLALSVAEHILDRYGNDPEVTELVDADEIWVAPMVNPDGVIQRSRYNANGVDLNRNYSHEWSASEFRAGSARSAEPTPSHPCARNPDRWGGLDPPGDEHRMVWTTATPTTDASLSRTALVYSDECDKPGFWITNGAEWYPTQGDTNDWAYGRHGVLDFTVEVSLLKTPPADALPGIIDAHIPAVMAFLQWPHRASGTVVDAVTGLPVPATIETGDGRLTTGPDGRFGRPIPEAGLIARVEAHGYRPQEASLLPGQPVEIRLDPASLTNIRPSPWWSHAQGSRWNFYEMPRSTLVRRGEVPVTAIAESGLERRHPDACSGSWSPWSTGRCPPTRCSSVKSTPPSLSTQQEWTAKAASTVRFGEGTRWACRPASIIRPRGAEDASRITLDTADLDDAAHGRPHRPVGDYQLALIDLFETRVSTPRRVPEDREPTATPEVQPGGSAVPLPPRGCHDPAIPGTGVVVTLLLAIRRRSS